MSEEMVEALARHMDEVSRASPFYDSTVDVTWEFYLDAARECLRQMEWTRQQPSTTGDYVGPTRLSDGTWSDARGILNIRPLPLTLAPPNWKPV